MYRCHLLQARVSVVGILAVTTVLQIISADRMYNIRAFRCALMTSAGLSAGALSD